MTYASPMLSALRNRPLRILFVEDNSADFELCVRALRRAKLEILPDLVRSESEFIEKLSGAPYDIILADYQLPGWNGMEALALMRERGKDIPFILVTGALGDEVVADCMKRGVADYVLKDRVARLPVAVCKALEERYLIEDRKLAYNQLHESEQKFRMLAESISSAIFIFRGAECRTQTALRSASPGIAGKSCWN